MKKILVMHGPNLNLLGTREPDIYGRITLDDIHHQLKELCLTHNVTLDTFQSNWEGALIDRLHHAKDEGVNYLIINPAGLTHTSISLRDALAGVHIPFIEVHLSNVYARENFRANSFMSPLAEGVISGLGAMGYQLALTYWLEKL